MAPTTIIVSVPTIYIRRTMFSSQLTVQHMPYSRSIAPTPCTFAAETQAIASILTALGDPATDCQLLERLLRYGPTQDDPILLIVDIDNLRVNRTVAIWYTRN